MNEHFKKIVQNIKKFDFKKYALSVLKRAYKNKVYILVGIALFLIYMFVFRDFGASYPKKIMAATVVLIAVIFSLLSEKIHNNAFVIILLVGILYCFTTPVLDTPDEVAHMQRAMYTSSGNFFLHPDDEKLQVSEDAGIINSQIYSTLHNNRLSEYKHSAKTEQAISLRATKAYSFISYLPQALGISVARALNLNLFWLFYLGRLFNLVTYAFMCRFAVKFIKEFKIQLMLFTVMPMAVYIAASYNQDAVVFGLIFILIAYYVNMFLGEDKSIGLKSILIFTSLCCVIATVKLPYVLLVCLLVFIPPGKFKTKKMYISAYLAVLVTAVLSALWLLYYINIPVFRTPENVDPAGQLSFILDNLAFSTKTISCAMLSFFSQLIQFFSFGWLTYTSHELALLYLFFIGGAVLLYFKNEEVPKLVKAGSFLVALVIYAAIWLAQYLTWTPVGLNRIEGVQGKYFIGLLPLLPLFLNVNFLKVPAEDKRVQKINLLFTGIAVYFLILSLTFTLNRYYL